MNLPRPMMNISQMAVKSEMNVRPFRTMYRSSLQKLCVFCGVLILASLISACAVVRSETVVKVALLAPFEGRYREVGYNALYAARLALQDAGTTNVELLPVDDGGTIQSAADRARALALDPAVGAVVALGYAATDESVLTAFGDIPVVIVGHWSAIPTGESVFMLASSELDDIITTPPAIGVTEAAELDTPLVGGEIFALEQFPQLRDSLDGITIVSSGSLPDDEFAERYLASDQFVPAPGLLATLTYDAFGMVARTMGDSVERGEISRAIAVMTYNGLNGDIRFENGYWADAPINYYSYDTNTGNILFRQMR